MAPTPDALTLDELRDLLPPVPAGAIPAFRDGTRVRVDFTPARAFRAPSDEVVEAYMGRTGTVLTADVDFALVQLDGDPPELPVIFWHFRLRRLS